MAWTFLDVWSRSQLISNELLSPAAKKDELISFSGPKRSFRRRNSADCKQRGTKWSAEGAERVPSQPARENPAAVSRFYGDFCVLREVKK